MKTSLVRVRKVSDWVTSTAVAMAMAMMVMVMVVVVALELLVEMKRGRSLA